MVDMHEVHEINQSSDNFTHSKSIKMTRETLKMKEASFSETLVNIY